MALFLPYVAVCHGILPTRKEFRPENRVLFSNKLGPQVFFKADSSIFIFFFNLGILGLIGSTENIT